MSYLETYKIVIETDSQGTPTGVQAPDLLKEKLQEAGFKIEEK